MALKTAILSTITITTATFAANRATPALAEHLQTKQLHAGDSNSVQWFEGVWLLQKSTPGN